MATEAEEATDGVQDGTSGSVEDSPDAMLIIARHLTEQAIGLMGELTPEAQFQVDIRKPEKRSKILEALLAEVCPNGVNEQLWRRWLGGGASPFPKTKQDWVGSKNERPAQTIIRTSKRVRTQEEKLARMRAEVEAEERQLAYLKAHDNAALHWHVADHLISIISAVFAMGPAWTLMRSVAPYASEEAANFETRSMDDGPAREKAKAVFRQKREAEGLKLLEALDFFGGDVQFENDLRKQIMDVVKFHERRRPDLEKEGRRKRSPERMARTVNAHARVDADEVIEALKLAS